MTPTMLTTPKITLLFCILAIPRITNSQEWNFPNGFKFGVATASFQIEGGWDADGKGPSIWDVLGHNRTSIIQDGSNGDVACNSYYKWEEDVEMVKNLGVDYYRISLSWPRILPDGTTNRINQAGVDYYNNIINKLLENGIETVVTIHHWDLPQRFSALGGWTNPILIPYYARFARTAFELFGDRVKTWITINEPRVICQNHKGLTGDVTSDFPLGISEYLCGHNILKAHAEAYHIYDQDFRFTQKGKISLTMDIPWTEPGNASNHEDVLAAERTVQFDFGIYANPVVNFDYPKVVIDRVAERSRLEGFAESRLPKFTLAEKLRIRGTYDFIGINHYTTRYCKAKADDAVTSPSIETDAGGERYYDPSWEVTAGSWIKVVPWGLRRALNWIKRTYQNPEIIITENGYPDDTELLEDEGRIRYHRGYLNATLQAILEDDVNVSGYMAWSLMDNMEWKRGYTLKFGLYHVNFTDPNRTRTPKKSVEFYRNVTRTRTVV